MIRDLAESFQLFELVPQYKLRFDPEFAVIDLLLEYDV